MIEKYILDIHYIKNGDSTLSFNKKLILFSFLTSLNYAYIDASHAGDDENACCELVVYQGPAQKEKATKNIDKKTELPISLSYRPDLYEIERIFAQQYPDFFTGINQIDPSIVRSIRQAAKDVGSEDGAIVVHDSKLVDLVRGLEKDIFELPVDAKIKRKLLTEISCKIQMEEVTPLWVWLMHFRVAVLKGQSSDEERQLFEHAINPEFFKGLFADGSATSELKAFINISEYDEDAVHNEEKYYGLSAISSKLFDRVEEEFAKHVPIKISYPLQNVGIIGIAQLVSSWLDDIYPIGFPNERIKAHSAFLSPAGFAIHDQLHAEGDPRFYGLKAYLFVQLNNHIAKGGDGNLFLENFAPVIAKNYVMLMSSLKEVYRSALLELLRQDEAKFRRVLSGFFLMLHEYPPFNANSFKCNDLSTVIEDLTKATLQAIEEDETMDAEDLLSREFEIPDIDLIAYGKQQLIKDDSITIPYSGQYTYVSPSYEEMKQILLNDPETQYEVEIKEKCAYVTIRTKYGAENTLTYQFSQKKWISSRYPEEFLKESEDSENIYDHQLLIEEAKKYALQNAVINTSNEAYKEHSDHFREKMITSLISKAYVQRSPHFVDVFFELKTGQKKRYSMATLVQKWLNADDFLGLLAFAGKFIVKPDLSQSDNPQIAAKETFDAMKKGLSELVSEFNDFAQYVVQSDRKGENLSDQYARKKSRREDAALFFTQRGEEKLAEQRVLMGL
jgi:hypothetical protein